MSQEKVMQPWWGQETLKLAIKQVDKGEISALMFRALTFPHVTPMKG